MSSSSSCSCTAALLDLVDRVGAAFAFGAGFDFALLAAGDLPLVALALAAGFGDDALDFGAGGAAPRPLRPFVLCGGDG